MTALKIPAVAKLIVKLMLAVSITVAAATFLSGPKQTNAATLAKGNTGSYGTVSVRVTPFHPDAMTQAAYNDAS